MNENQEYILTHSIESLAIDVKRIADALEVLAGAKPINSIANIVPGSEVELFDGSFAAQVYCNTENENRYFLYCRKRKEKIDCGEPCWYTQFKLVEGGFRCHKCLKFYSIKDYYC